ncbi:LPS-assembly protein LptD [Novispirillum itersonii]|uniref:LPS-assembly protein LptD n=1 Tax=Novispirillum itersonii TaxID=189 RepID=UPI0003726027|nr:LPS assembly protein LptD [Novispirillum itersonii]
MRRTRRLIPFSPASLAYASFLASCLATVAFPAGAATQPAAQTGAPSGAGTADEPSTEGRAVITADELSHDKNLDTVTARGKVEVQYQGRILLADTVNYQVTADRASATGNVIITELDGTTTFADFAELSGDLKEGFVREVKFLLTDGSRAAARTATRKTDASGNAITEMENAIYSPCDVCSDTPGSDTRIWQIKSKRVVHDQKAGDITYNDMWFELFGMPVAYTPYMSHPDPSVKRRSGFLPPSYRVNNQLGVGVNIPYFFVIDDQQDATLAIMPSTNENPVLSGEYRGVSRKASLAMSGSVTQDKDDQIRNHFKGKAVANLDNAYRVGADVNLTSDRTYMRRYRFGNQSYLTSRGYIEGFSRRSYASAEALYFQNLSSLATTRGDLPIAAPVASWNYSSEPGTRGAYTTVDITSAAVTRMSGTSSRRVSAEYGWHLPYIGPIGDVYRLDVGMSGDAYHVEDVMTGSGEYYTGAKGRVTPLAALTWSLPLERRNGQWTEVIRPIVQGVSTQGSTNPSEIPNEDSYAVEFDDTNLFSPNRFGGRDRIESGTRVSYGMEYTASHARVGAINALVGQSYRLSGTGHSAFPVNSGLDKDLSDVVGRMVLRPSSNLDLIYRFRADGETLDLHRSEAAVRVGPRALSLYTAYAQLDRAEDSSAILQKRQEASVTVQSQFSQYWLSQVGLRYDLADNGGPLEVGGTLAYEDECFGLALSVNRSYTYDVDYDGSFSVGLRFAFKTLGDFSTSSSGLGF